ncbi:MAG: putative rane protein [Alphaproteobacteria bacterium]|jgi:putative membrane protein|nr:putative rane protein [Alphaproteobacteria bacterium]
MVTPAALTEEDHERLTREIRDAEAATSGEIYVVVAHSPDAFRLVPIFWAALFALLLAWVLDLGTGLSTSMILSLQASGFIAVSVLLSVPFLRYRIVPAALAEDAAHRAAHAQFMAHGVHLTPARTGVLIYVSLLPRRIEILADSGIHAKLDQAVWDEAVARLAGEIRNGPLSQALAHAIRDLGALLAVHFPRAKGDRNELPNRVIEV